MSGDLDPTLFDALIEGSRRTACCDEAELRTHQLRNHRNAQRTREQFEPLVSWPAFGFFFTLYCPGEALPILAAARRSAEVLGDVPGGFLRLCQPVGKPLVERATVSAIFHKIFPRPTWDVRVLQRSRRNLQRRRR